MFVTACQRDKLSISCARIKPKSVSTAFDSKRTVSSCSCAHIQWQAYDFCLLQAIFSTVPEDLCCKNILAVSVLFFCSQSRLSHDGLKSLEVRSENTACRNNKDAGQMAKGRYRSISPSGVGRQRGKTQETVATQAVLLKAAQRQEKSCGGTNEF